MGLIASLGHDGGGGGHRRQSANDILKTVAERGQERWRLVRLVENLVVERGRAQSPFPGLIGCSRILLLPGMRSSQSVQLSYRRPPDYQVCRFLPPGAIRQIRACHAVVVPPSSPDSPVARPFVIDNCVADQVNPRSLAVD